MDDQKTKIARAIWSELREDLDKCDLEVEDLHRGDRLWVYADIAHAAAQAEIARLRGALEPDRIGGDFLDWVADRLVKTHGDSENADFVIALRRIAQNVQNALEQAK